MIYLRMKIFQLNETTAIQIKKDQISEIITTCAFDYRCSSYNRQILFVNRENHQYYVLDYLGILMEKGNWWFAAYNIFMTFKYDGRLITVTVEGERDIPGTAGEKSRRISGKFSLSLVDHSLSIIEND